MLVHHEYAALAETEKSVTDQSVRTLSRKAPQRSDFSVPRLVARTRTLGVGFDSLVRAASILARTGPMSTGDVTAKITTVPLAARVFPKSALYAPR